MSTNTICKGRYEVIPSDFEVGRSGIPGLARDTKTGTRVFTKRPNTDDPLKYDVQLRNIKNEEKALRELNGFCVPELLMLDGCSTWLSINGGLRELRYLIVELMDEADRVEKNYPKLTRLERADILVQLFECLKKARDRNIVNGDIDLKHLYWQRHRARLVMIDWGNSEHGTEENPLDPGAYAFDIAKAAEIVYTLTTLQTYPVDVSIPLHPLPDNVPPLFHKLCEWAPRQGRPGSDEGKFTATNLAEEARYWSSQLKKDVDTLLNHWVPQWISNPEGGGWQEDLQKTIELAPHYVLARLASAAVSRAKIQKEINDLESRYRTACQRGQWREAQQVVLHLLARESLPHFPGEQLSQLLFHLSKKKEPTVDNLGKAALSDALGELLDERDARNNELQIGEALTEVAARRLLSPCPEELCKVWAAGSLTAQLRAVVHWLQKEQYTTPENRLSDLKYVISFPWRKRRHGG